VRLSALALVFACVTVAPAIAIAKPEEPAASPQEREAREKSRAAFRAGVAQLKAQDWKAARSSFEQAWALYPHPSILLNLGIARLRTDDPVLAEQDFVRFLSEDFGSTPEELAGAREALAEARTKIGTIRIVASPASARIVVDGKTIAERVRSETEREGIVAEVRAKAGKHSVAADADGYTAQERNVDLAAKGEIEVKLALAPIPKSGGGGSTTNPPPDGEGPNGRAIMGYAAGGLAVIGLAAGAFCGLRAISLKNDYEDKSKADSFQNASVKSEGQTFRTLADVGFGVAIVGGVAAVILLFTDIGSSKGTDVGRPFVWKW